jgi:glycerol-3-phosphate dehydrogenase (NAD(P)+)
MTAIAIIGGGAWGTALACVARRAGNEAVIWAREDEVAAAINERQENTPFLPGVTLDPDIRAVTDMKDAVAGADSVLLVAPAQHLRAVSIELARHLTPGVPVVVCAKGIERQSGALMSEVLAETMKEAPVAVLSGPTFAREVAAGLPTAVTLAAADEALGAVLVRMLGDPLFRPYLSPDPIGAQIGGAVKNVLAIACGIVAGKGLGENARAALITRGLAEMVRLGRAKRAKRETLMGLSGLGDLVLTCNGEQSRNMSLGMALGRGETLDDILAARTSVAEGVATASSVVALAGRLDVDMPIAGAVHAILDRGASVDSVIEGLLARPFRPEG